MRLYPQLQQLSDKMIRQFGSPCIVKRQGERKYNPSTGEFRSGEAQAFSAYCLFDNLAYDFSANNENQVAIQQGDVMIYVTAEGHPDVNSLIEVNNEYWAVIHCQPIKPASTVLLYQCQGRKR